MLRETASPEVAANILEMVYEMDVTDQLERVQAPTLVIQRRNDRAFSPRHGRMLAAGIPDARLVLLEGDQHAPWRGDVEALTQEICSFIEEGERPPDVDETALPPLIRIILFTDVERSTDLTDRFAI